MKGIRHVNSNYRFWFKSVGYYLSRVDDILYIGFLESLGDDFAASRLGPTAQRRGLVTPRAGVYG